MLPDFLYLVSTAQTDTSVLSLGCSVVFSSSSILCTAVSWLPILTVVCYRECKKCLRGVCLGLLWAQAFKWAGGNSWATFEQRIWNTSSPEYKSFCLESTRWRRWPGKVTQMANSSLMSRSHYSQWHQAQYSPRTKYSIVCCGWSTAIALCMILYKYRDELKIMCGFVKGSSVGTWHSCQWRLGEIRYILLFVLYSVNFPNPYTLMKSCPPTLSFIYHTHREKPL